MPVNPRMTAQVPVQYARFWRLYGEPIVIVAAASRVIAAVVSTQIERGGDFWSFYDSSIAMRLGQSVYAYHHLSHIRNLNAPATLLLFAPLAWIPERLALILWQVLQLACFLTAAFIVQRETTVRPAIVLGVLGVSETINSMLRLGQMTGILALILTLAWSWDRSDRHPVGVGVLLGLSSYAKPFLGLFAVWMLWRRAWPTIAGLALGGVLAVAVGWVAFGRATYVEWLATLGAVEWQSHPLNASIAGLADRLFGADTPLTLAFVHAPRTASTLTLIGCVIVSAVLLRALQRKPGPDQAWALILLAAVLLSPLGWLYYLPLAIGPLVAFARSHGPHWTVALGVVLLCVPHNELTTQSAWASATYAAPYIYGTLCLFAYVVRSPARLLAAPPSRPFEGE